MTMCDGKFSGNSRPGAAARAVYATPTTDGMDLGLLSRRLGHSSYSFTFERYARGVKAEHTKAMTENTQRRWRSASGS